MILYSRRDLSITTRLVILAVGIVVPAIAFSAMATSRYVQAILIGEANAALVLASSAGVAILATALVALWAGREIAAPIAALSLSAAALGRGERPPPPPPGVREASDVCRALVAAYDALARRDEALRSGESRYRAIVETALDAIIVIDEDGVIGAFNKAAETLTGYDHAEMIGQSVEILLAPMLAARNCRDIAAYLRQVEACVIGAGREIELGRRDGSLVPADLAVVEWSAGNRRYFTGVFRDLSAHKRDEQTRAKLEEQLRQSQKMEAIGQLTGGIAHDFNNLLVAINLNLEALAESVPATEENRPLVDGARQAIDQVRTLIRQLLAFARRQALVPTSFAVNEAVHEAAQMLRRTMPATITFATRLADDLYPAFADRNQFGTALLNLAVNAGDAMPAGGRLVIETANATLDEAYAATHPDVLVGDYVMIAVSDSGAGMPPSVVARAFDPFFTTKQPGEGTGLGLSQVYGYMKQSGGHATIHSQPGHGTTAKLFLPRSHVEPDRTERRQAASARATRGETILLVEDTPLVRNAVTRMLADLGYRVIAAANGHEAIAVLESDNPIDLLFTDMVMPGGVSGTDLARETERLRPGLRVLFTSGYAEKTFPDLARQQPAIELISKPYTRVELAERLREVLGGRVLSPVGTDRGF